MDTKAVKKKRIDNKIIRQHVYQDFESGQHCAETVSKTILEIFSSQPASAAVKGAMAFGGGIAGTFEEVCGALSGGVLALGHIFGRQDPNMNRMALGELTRQFREQFFSEFGSTHCGTLRKGFADRNEPLGCVRLSAQAAVILADLLYRFESEKDMPVEIWEQGLHEKTPAGSCPFKMAASRQLSAVVR